MDFSALMQMLMQNAGMGGQMMPPQAGMQQGGALPVMPQMPGMNMAQMPPVPMPIPAQPSPLQLFTKPPAVQAPVVAPPVTPARTPGNNTQQRRSAEGGGSRGASSRGNPGGFGGH